MAIANPTTGQTLSIASATAGDTYKVLSISGDEKIKGFLQTLGLIKDTEITLISKAGTNYIIHIKDSRYAVDSKLASQITVTKV